MEIGGQLDFIVRLPEWRQEIIWSNGQPLEQPLELTRAN